MGSISRKDRNSIMKNKPNISLVVIAVMIIAFIIIIAIAYLPGQEDTKLTVIYAGSLVAPFDKMEQAFESETGRDRLCI